MRDSRCAEHAPADQRQVAGRDIDRDHRIALHQVADGGPRGNAVGHVDNSGTPESDVVENPDRQFRQPRERRDMLEMSERDQIEEKILGLAVEHHGPAAGLDAVGGDFTHQPSMRSAVA
jgi:hypothetical protein